MHWQNSKKWLTSHRQSRQDCAWHGVIGAWHGVSVKESFRRTVHHARYKHCGSTHLRLKVTRVLHRSLLRGVCSPQQNVSAAWGALSVSSKGLSWSSLWTAVASSGLLDMLRANCSSQERIPAQCSVIEHRDLFRACKVMDEVRPSSLHRQTCNKGDNTER